MRADRLAWIADIDRNLDARIEHLAAIPHRLARGAPHVELLRRPADVDRDRFERKVRFARGPGRVDPFEFRRLGGVRCGIARVEPLPGFGTHRVELPAQFRNPSRGLSLQILGLRPGLIRPCTDQRLVRRCEFRIRALLRRFEIAQRRRERCGFARRQRCGSFRLVVSPRRLRRLTRERLRPRARRRQRLRVRHQQRRVGKRNRSGVVRRDDHPHSDPRPVEQPLRKTERQPHAAVRSRMAGQRSAVQRDAVPGDALHVRHPGIVIHVRAVVFSLLNDRKDSGRRLVVGRAGRDRRAQDPAVGIVEGDLLAFDRHDRHDGLAALARRHLLPRRLTALLPRRRIGGQQYQRRRRSKHGPGGAIPAPPGSGGRAVVWHSLPRLKALPGPASNKARSRSIGLPFHIPRRTLPETVTDRLDSRPQAAPNQNIENNPMQSSRGTLPSTQLSARTF